MRLIESLLIALFGAVSIASQTPTHNPCTCAADYCGYCESSNKQNPKIFECGLLNGAAISRPKPNYPAKAKARGITGSVLVYVKIDEEGKVYLAKSCGGQSMLRRAAIEAAYKARFHPTTMSGKPIKIDGVLVYNFIG
jgi:TonB family protein